MKRSYPAPSLVGVFIAAAFALMFAACDDSANLEASATGGAKTGGAGGVGGGGAGGGGGAEDGGGAGGQLLPPNTCDLGDAPAGQLEEIEIPGIGLVWPMDNPVGEGGAGGSGAESGCQWSAVSHGGGSATCRGMASIERASSDELEATYEDGSVARVTLPGASVPSTGKIALSLDASVTRSNPYGAPRSQTRIEGRDELGKLVWLVADELRLEESVEIFEAPLEAVERCSKQFTTFCNDTYETRIFDMVVQGEPEQTILAGDVSSVPTSDGTYLVNWVLASMQKISPGYGCADGDPPRSPSRVSVVLEKQ